MPEEINRILTDSISDLLFTTSQDADENLKQEGIPPDRIVFVGNVMIDSLLEHLKLSESSDIRQTLGIDGKDYAVLTLHRPSNVDNEASLRTIMAELSRLARQVPVVFPMHPRTRKMCQEFNIPLDAIGTLKILEPIGYHDSICLTENALLVLTDSGGLQEEATYFRTPCLTLRPNTERPITVTVGSNRLTTTELLPYDAQTILSGPQQIGQVPELWDGHTAERTLKHLLAASVV